jgi:hypothetical protein
MFNLPGANRTQVVPTIMGMSSSLPPIHYGQGSFAPGTGVPNLARQSRRLYVGNITYEANETNLQDFFNRKMVEMKIGTGGGGDPVIGVQINHEKSYAFVEFRSAEDATAAMAFDGIMFQSGPLKIRRPKDYTGSDLSAPMGVHVPGVVSTNVPDSINKIFVGGLPTYLDENQVMELLKSFGELKAFNLVRENGNGASKLKLPNSRAELLFSQPTPRKALPFSSMSTHRSRTSPSRVSTEWSLVIVSSSSNALRSAPSPAYQASRPNYLHLPSRVRSCPSLRVRIPTRVTPPSCSCSTWLRLKIS